MRKQSISFAQVMKIL